MTLAKANVEPFDDATAGAFSEKLAGIINSGAVAVMLSVGHRTGLFDTMAELGFACSARIAERAGLAERYVREWLAAMVSAGIADYDPDTRRYRLPPEHAASLCRQAPLGNLAVYAQLVPMAGSMQDRLLQCFRTGEGMKYEEYPCFHQIMAEDSGQTVVARLFDSILPLIDGIEHRLEQGIDVLDAGCGAGKALIAMARRYPASRFTGYDLSPEAIAMAETSARGLANVRFGVRDLVDFAETASYDLITSFDAIHDLPDPPGLVESMHRALRPGGVYLVQDIGGSARLENNLEFPFASFLYTVSCVHCMPVSLGQGGPGLGTMWGWETALELLETAGFSSLERKVLEHDPMNVWFIARK